MAREPRGKQASPSPKRRRRWLRWIVVPLVVILSVGVLAAGVSAFWVLTILPRSLPSVAQLESFEPSVGSKVYDENDEQITELHVERRIFVPLAQMPAALKQAVIATEDARFYSHFGVDPMGIARAVYQNFRRGRIVEGGSTITQQLAKVLFLTPDRSLDRKLKEAVLPSSSSAATRKTASSRCTLTRSTSVTAPSAWKRRPARSLAKASTSSLPPSAPFSPVCRRRLRPTHPSSIRRRPSAGAPLSFPAWWTRA